MGRSRYGGWQRQLRRLIKAYHAHGEFDPVIFGLPETKSPAEPTAKFSAPALNRDFPIPVITCVPLPVQGLPTPDTFAHADPHAAPPREEPCRESLWPAV